MGNKDKLLIPASEYAPEEEIGYGEFKVALIAGSKNKKGNNIKLNLLCILGAGAKKLHKCGCRYVNVYTLKKYILGYTPHKKGLKY